MRDFLIKNVSNIYCLLKMDDLEVFGQKNNQKLF